MRSSGNNLLWLEEDGRIAGKYRKPNFGIFGSCRPQPREVVNELCLLQAGTNFPQHTVKHRSGQNTVQVVCSALRVLPGIQIQQTPPNCSADVHWKWDLILEYQNNFYPIQIKSGIDDIWKCQGQIFSKIQEIEDEVEAIWKRYENKIEDLMVQYAWETRENKAIVALEKERHQRLYPLKEKLKEHKNRVPLFVWASEDEETITDLVYAFATLFRSQGSRKEFIQQAIKGYREARLQAVKPVEVEPTHFQTTQLKIRGSQSSINGLSQSHLPQQMNLVDLHEQSVVSKKSYSVEEIRKRYPRAYELWSVEEDQQLRLRYFQLPSLDALGTEFGRKPSAIRSRLKKLSLL